MTPEAFFAQEMRHPFSWEDGRDCLRTADRWCVAFGRPSFFAASRLKFATFAEAHNLMLDHSMPIWVNRAMLAAGYRSSPEPKPGDVGIVCSGSFVACAVKISIGWLFRDERGLHCYGPYARVLRVWSI